MFSFLLTALTLSREFQGLSVKPGNHNRIPDPEGIPRYSSLGITAQPYTPSFGEVTRSLWEKFSIISAHHMLAPMGMRQQRIISLQRLGRQDKIHAQLGNHVSNLLGIENTQLMVRNPMTNSTYRRLFRNPKLHNGPQY
jgi:hypothetical protein